MRMEKRDLKYIASAIIGDNSAANMRPNSENLRFHGHTGRHNFLEGLTLRIFGQKLPFYRTHVLALINSLGRVDNVCFIDSAEAQSTEILEMTKIASTIIR